MSSNNFNNSGKKEDVDFDKYMNPNLDLHDDDGLDFSLLNPIDTKIRDEGTELKQEIINKTILLKKLQAERLLDLELTFDAVKEALKNEEESIAVIGVGKNLKILQSVKLTSISEEEKQLNTIINPIQSSRIRKFELGIERYRKDLTEVIFKIRLILENNIRLNIGIEQVKFIKILKAFETEFLIHGNLLKKKKEEEKKLKDQCDQLDNYITINNVKLSKMNYKKKDYYNMLIDSDDENQSLINKNKVRDLPTRSDIDEDEFTLLNRKRDSFPSELEINNNVESRRDTTKKILQQNDNEQVYIVDGKSYKVVYTPEANKQLDLLGIMSEYTFEEFISIYKEEESRFQEFNKNNKLAPKETFDEMVAANNKFYADDQVRPVPIVASMINRISDEIRIRKLFKNPVEEHKMIKKYLEMKESIAGKIEIEKKRESDAEKTWENLSAKPWLNSEMFLGALGQLWGDNYSFGDLFNVDFSDCVASLDPNIIDKVLLPYVNSAKKLRRWAAGLLINLQSQKCDGFIQNKTLNNISIEDIFITDPQFRGVIMFHDPLVLSNFIAVVHRRKANMEEIDRVIYANCDHCFEAYYKNKNLKITVLSLIGRKTSIQAGIEPSYDIAFSVAVNYLLDCIGLDHLTTQEIAVIHAKVPPRALLSRWMTAGFQDEEVFNRRRAFIKLMGEKGLTISVEPFQYKGLRSIFGGYNKFGRAHVPLSDVFEAYPRLEDKNFMISGFYMDEYSDDPVKKHHTMCYCAATKKFKDFHWDYLGHDFDQVQSGTMNLIFWKPTILQSYFEIIEFDKFTNPKNLGMLKEYVCPKFKQGECKLDKLILIPGSDVEERTPGENMNLESINLKDIILSNVNLPINKKKK